MRRAPLWIVIAGGVIAGGIALDAIGLPSSYLFAALLLGLAIALARPDRFGLDPRASAPHRPWPASARRLPAERGAARRRRLARAGAARLGRDARDQPRRRRAPDPHDAAGPAHRRARDDAGGASGIVGMSGELGADDRLVAFMQYLRVSWWCC